MKWRLRPEAIVRLQEYQIQILRAAMQQVAPGGRLIYSTCSLEPEENEVVVEKVLAEDGSFRVVDCRDEVTRLQVAGELHTDKSEPLLRGPYLRTIPGVHECDGFFAALLKKRAIDLADSSGSRAKPSDKILHSAVDLESSQAGFRMA